MEPISGQEFTCDNCKKVFWASSDRAAPAKYRWFLEELSFLRINKRYSLYALTLCQTLEMFFYQAIINKMFDRNTEFRDEEGRIYTDKYNQERKEYEKYIEKLTFYPMKKIFLETYKNEINAYLPQGISLKKG